MGYFQPKLWVDAIMKIQKSEWQNLEDYFEAFEQLTLQFINELDSRKVAQLDATLSQTQLSDKGLELSQCVNRLTQEIVPQLSASRGLQWSNITRHLIKR